MLQHSATQHIFSSSSNSNLELVIKNNAVRLVCLRMRLKVLLFSLRQGSLWDTVEARGQSQVLAFTLSLA